MIIALASPRIATSREDGLAKIQRLISEAASQRAEIVCFPEAYLPGLRGQDFEVLPWDKQHEALVLETVCEYAHSFQVATILGIERITDAGRQIAAVVINADGTIQGYQTKIQLDPSEDQFYVPGNSRRMFAVNGVKFGVVICHEGCGIL